VHIIVLLYDSICVNAECFNLSICVDMSAHCMYVSECVNCARECGYFFQCGTCCRLYFHEGAAMTQSISHVLFTKDVDTPFLYLIVCRPCDSLQQDIV
jgi:hypothetical protein